MFKFLNFIFWIISILNVYLFLFYFLFYLWMYFQIFFYHYGHCRVDWILHIVWWWVRKPTKKSRLLHRVKKLKRVQNYMKIRLWYRIGFSFWDAFKFSANQGCYLSFIQRNVRIITRGCSCRIAAIASTTLRCPCSMPQNRERTQWCCIIRRGRTKRKKHRSSHLSEILQT